MSKVFFSHTTKFEAVKAGVIPACTIALKREGDKFFYGISMASKYDNFSKKYGREIAEYRLSNGFGIIDVPEVLKDLPEKEACLHQLYNLTASVYVRSKKWKKRITSFNNTQKIAIGKVIPMDTLKIVG